MDIMKEKQVMILSTDRCGYCVKAKNLLEQNSIGFREVNMDKMHPNDSYEVVNCIFGTPRYHVPVIYMNSKKLDGYGELLQMQRDGALTPNKE
mgnify:CR=1 FL=1|jgi:glutaredoxin 3